MQENTHSVWKNANAVRKNTNAIWKNTGSIFLSQGLGLFSRAARGKDAGLMQSKCGVCSEVYTW